MHKTLFSLTLLLALPLGCGEPVDGSVTQGQALHNHTSEEGCQQAAAAAQASKPHKVTICHIPPGNPDNAHTINVGKKAVRAHLAHGDVLGGCGCDSDNDDQPSQPAPDADRPSDDDRPSGDEPEPTPTPTDDQPPSLDTTPDGSSTPAPSGDAPMCDADQGGCTHEGQCLSQQACDTTSGCCVDVFL